MKLFKVSLPEKAKKVLKFEAKLLLGAAALALIVYFGMLAFIYNAGEYVADAYTGGIYTSHLK